MYTTLPNLETVLNIHLLSLRTSKNADILIDFAKTKVLNKNKFYYYKRTSLATEISSTKNLVAAKICGRTAVDYYDTYRSFL